MGTQSSTILGFGFQLPDTIVTDEQVIWDDVEDNFPLLDFTLVGDYWNNDVRPSMIYVKATSQKMAGLSIIEMNPVSAIFPEALEQLKIVAEKHKLGKVKIGWFVWSYRG